ncbi:putative quinol monooxygenase [Mycobacterium sp. HNNTM2301]|uniref:putative quinol monooxygenase n=1 Tax=Mycobacterium hainanense TaxID=3289775 RepID=UPI0035A65255
MTYHVIVQFVVPADRHDHFIEQAQRDAEQSLRNEPDTLAFSVLRDEHDPERFFLDEVYEDKAAFEYHTKQAAFNNFIEAVRSYADGPTFLVQGFSLAPSTITR